MEPAVTTTIQPHASVVLGTQPAPGPRQQRPPLVALSAKVRGRGPGAGFEQRRGRWGRPAATAANRLSTRLHPPLQGCTHALKLRESFKLDAVTSLELGLDFQLESVESGTYHQLLKTAPCAAIQRQLDPEDRSKGVLRADMHHLSFSRRFNLVDGKLPLDAKLGLTYEGEYEGERSKA